MAAKSGSLGGLPLILGGSVCPVKQKRRTAWRYGVEAVLLFQDPYLTDATPRAVAAVRIFFTIGNSCLALPRLF